MMDNPLCSASAIQSVRRKYGFALRKSLGQNFLIDPSVPRRIAELSGIDKSCGVLEIGPGIGPLTYELCASAAHVAAVELDDALIPVLKENLRAFDNLSVIHGDIMKLDLQNLLHDEFRARGIQVVHVCANLPYYITTPIVMRLLEANADFQAVTVMVQKEVALRLCAEPGSSDFGAITLSVNYFTIPEYLFEVPPASFLPAPKVSSAVIRLVRRTEPPVRPKNRDFMFQVIKAAFSQRRKTLINALSNTLPSVSREKAAQALKGLSLPADIRGERLSLAQYSDLSDILYC